MHADAHLADRQEKLTKRQTFTLGDVHIEPALHRISGPGGSITVEQRVMQVLLALAETPGQVLSRDELLLQCWPGLTVGQDSLSRAIAEARRALASAGSNRISIETIPKSGYRLLCEESAAQQPTPAPPHDRRRFLAGGVALAGLAAAGAWYATSPRRRAATLLRGAETALARDDYPGVVQAGAMFEAALAEDPGNAHGWGRLAIAHLRQREYENAVDPDDDARDPAIQRALLLNPDQPDALAARAIARTGYGRWTEAHAALTNVVDRFPAQADAVESLAALQERTGETQNAANRAMRLYLQQPTLRLRQSAARCLWSAGDVGKLGRVLDPADSGQDMAHIWYLALTGRTAAAIAYLDGKSGPNSAPQPVHDAIRATLIARESGAAQDLSNATAAAMRIAGKGHFGTSVAIAQLATLGAIDEALAVAEGYYLERGPIRVSYNSAIWSDTHRAELTRRNTRPLFMAQTAPLRADARFEALVGDMGLQRYWEAAGIIPDYRRAGR